MSKVIFSDFDGVLFDSVKEAYILSRYAYDNIDFKEIIQESEFQFFRKYRYLITHSWQFYIIFTLIKQKINDEEFELSYHNHISEKGKKEASKFDEKYVQGREFLLKTDYTFWDNLDIPFDFFYELKKLSEEIDYKIFILTNKKKLPVSNKLKKYGADKFNIFAQEDLTKYKNKAEFINEYMCINKLKNAILIEDSIDNINECNKYQNIETILVDWGYISPKEKGKSLKDVLKIIQEVI